MLNTDSDAISIFYYMIFQWTVKLYFDCFETMLTISDADENNVNKLKSRQKYTPS
jgi:hypothetical protein